MADTPRDGAPRRNQISNTPRWVKLSAVVAVVVLTAVLLAFVVSGEGGHGPGRHMTPSITSQESPAP